MSRAALDIDAPGSLRQLSTFRSSLFDAHMAARLFVGLARALKSAAVRTIQEVLCPNLMTRPEAVRILGLHSNFESRELESKFAQMYSANSLKNRGSPYIQSKIHQAYSFLKTKEQKR